MSDRAIVAEFYKSAGGRLSLSSLTVIAEEVARDGSGKTWLARNIYDVELSRAYGYLYHQSGAGGGDAVSVEGIYFASGDVKIKENPCQLCERSRTTGRWKTREVRARNKTRRLPRLPKAFRSEASRDLLEWLEIHGIEGDSVYCSECRDSFPESSLCEHCWWCDVDCWWSTPSERCSHPGKDCYGDDLPETESSSQASAPQAEEERK